MIALLLAGALLSAPDPYTVPGPYTAPGGQDPAAEAVAPQDAPVRLEDVTVTGRPLDSLIRDFVSEVAEPNPRRGLARWSGDICVGVANLRADAAQYLADRVSTVAEDLGLDPGQPGCTPTIMIVATGDGGELARTLVDERRRAFRMGGSGMDRGGVALADFRDADRPVRWWQMSMPVDSETGLRATRIPGECRDACLDPVDYAPQINVFAASRLRTQIVDNIFRTIVIVDVDDVAQLSIQQLADYIAMVTLAQINPDADTSAYSSILNVFDDPESSPHLTDWDLAYLGGLYAAERNHLNRRANRTEVAASIRRAHERVREDEDAATDD